MAGDANTQRFEFRAANVVDLKLSGFVVVTGIAYTILMMLLNAVYLYDVFPKRVATSPLPLIDCIENTLFASFLGIALYVSVLCERKRCHRFRQTR